MSATREAMSKLNDQQRNYIEVHKGDFQRFGEERLDRLKTEERARIQGFVAGMVSCGIITEYQGRLIYAYATL